MINLIRIVVAEARRELLAPPSTEVHDAATAMSAIARLREARRDGLADYLEARQLTFRERFDLALPLLLRAQERGLPTPRLERESARMRAVTLFALGRLDEAEALFRSVTNERDAADVVYRDDWLARLQWQRARGI